VSKAHRLLYHSTLGLRVIKKKRTSRQPRLSLPVLSEESGAAIKITFHLKQEADDLQGYLAHMKPPPPLGPP